MASSRGWSPQEHAEGLAEREVASARAAAAAATTRGTGGPATRPDTPPFAHLSVRTSFSMRDGAIRPEELVAATAAAGSSHVAVTDRDGLYGAVRVAQAAAAHGVTPVYGVDLALAPDPDRPGWQVTRGGRHRPRATSPAAPTADGRAGARNVRDPGWPTRAGAGPDGRPAAGAAWLEDDAARVTLLARTTAGYGALCRTVTHAHAHARGAPHLGADDLAAELGGADDGAVVALLGPDAPVGRLLAADRREAAAAELRRWLDVLGTDGVRLAVRHHHVGPGTRPGPGGVVEPGDDARIRRTLALGAEVGVGVVAVNDARYLRPADVVLADVLRCVRRQVPLARHHLERTTAEAWLTTPAEQHLRFAERPDLLVAAHELATSCAVDLGVGGLHVPRLTGLDPALAAGELHRRCWAGVADRYPRVTPAVRERLEHELATIDRLGLHDLFLAVADVVDDVREVGILAACRGSAAGSLVCFALRISDVDPIAHGLAFERFLNPYRDELPDIDLDVESARREDVYDLVTARFGEHRTACVAMFETFQARSAIREVGKVLGMPDTELGAVAKAFTHARARHVRRAIGDLPELAGSRLDAGQLDALFDLVERLDGFPRHLALHPCGILLGDVTLTERTPLERSAHRRGGDGDRPAGFAVSQFDKDDVAALGLLKLDVLGVRMLSSMRHCLDLVNGTGGGGTVIAADGTEVTLPGWTATRPPAPGAPGRDAAGRLDVHAIPHDDPATYALLRTTRSVGVFQVESPGQRELLARLQPERFDDLIAEISLFRPGPVKADMVSPFVARRHGHEPVELAHPALGPVLADTHGVIVYHEQVMGVISALTGCDLAYADLVRRQLSDPAKRGALRGWLVAGAVDRGVPREAAHRIWDQLAAFASFGFCKAHAAAFAVPTVRSAFLKRHLLPEFVAGLLTHDPGMYPKRMILDEARLFGVAVLPADVNRAHAEAIVEVLDRGQADHLLGSRPAVAAHAAGHDPVPHLPPGWRWDAEVAAPIPPGGFDAGDAGGGYRYAVRVGLADVRGITSAEIDALLAGRPFTTLEDLRARSGLSRPVAEQLVEAGGLDQLAGVGRRGGPRTRGALRLAVEELWRAPRGRGVGGGRAARGRVAAAEQTALDLHADHEPDLPDPGDAAAIRAELAATGMDVSRHVLSFYEPLLEVLGVVRAADLDAVPNQTRVRVAGVKVAVQSPAQRSGQRVLFLSLDDRTGQTQTTYFERTLPDVAWTVLHAWLLVAEGRVTRRGHHHAAGAGGALGGTITGVRAWDLSRLWRAWQEGWLDAALAERGTPAPHERDVARPTGLHASEWGRGSR